VNEFDHRPDSELGDALREMLSAPDDAAFVRRVMDHVPPVIARETWWEILGAWARPGVAAAVAVLAAATVWMSQEQRSEVVAAGEGLVAAAETVTAQTLLGAGAMPEFRVEMVMGEERVNE
jgi:hypothetical protein